MKLEISKDEINELPLGKYEGEIVIVDDFLSINSALEEIANENIIGFDTETKPSFKKGVINNTALIQIATKKKVYLFRLNKIGFPYSLIQILEDPNILKVGIAINQDIKELNEQFREFDFVNVIDLNVLCKSQGFKNVGARNLSAITLGFRISKRQQTSNWEADELSEGQLRYAATDAWVCREIFLRLFLDKESKFNISNL